MNKLSRILEAHATSGSKLKLDECIPDRRDSSEEEFIQDSYIRITGDCESLRFLGELLQEFASGDHGCSFDIHPNGAGANHFASGSELGIFLVKRPCI